MTLSLVPNMFTLATLWGVIEIYICILQSCSPGYKREGNMLVGGRCVPCECNNHADVCDPYTGICQVCYFNIHQKYC